jgi:hypothetical protein
MRHFLIPEALGRIHLYLAARSSTERASARFRKSETSGLMAPLLRVTVCHKLPYAANGERQG